MDPYMRVTEESHGVPVLIGADSARRTTSLCFSIAFGGRHDSPEGSGAAHLMEHLLMSAPLDGGASLAERIEGLGGECNASTGPESLLFFAQVMNEDACAVAQWMTQAVLHPEIDDKIFDSERRVVLTELAAAAADPSDIVQERFLAELFRGHPLSQPSGGTEESVRELTLNIVEESHRRATTTRPMAFSAVGGIDPEALRATLGNSALASAAVAPLTSGGPVAEPPALPLVSQRTDPSWPDEFCWLVAGGRAPRLADRERFASVVLGHLLGSSAASPLYQRLRGENALAYMFRSWSRSYSDTGAWRFLAGAEPENAPRVLEEFRSALSEVADKGPLEGSLAAARRLAVMEAVREAEDPLEHAITLANQRCALPGPWDPEQHIQAVLATTGEEVAAAAARLSDELLVVASPEGA
ncbi:M16 family metallopeptidase [Streptomyces lavendulae]|uniref:M16 family metallopeptidase n=1 Tax=Streptomyces lavendulae TaxID=1914 RepID=UPI0025540E94|nr:pitrilysin family protein [Streptomyces lavendulae]